MRKLVVQTFVTLDGVMPAPGGPEEDLSGGFEHGGWSVNHWDEAMAQEMGMASSETSTTGVVMATYRRAGAVETGSFALDQPTAAELERRARADT